MRHIARHQAEDPETGANRQTASLAALALTLLLVVVSVSLMNHLRFIATVQDCLLSGRTNCGVAVPIQP